jgi:dTDP-4-amino-4,6-dideoxygalactose transaminase
MKQIYKGKIKISCLLSSYKAFQYLCGKLLCMSDHIPMLDLRHEIAELKDEIQAAISRVLDSTAFILGPEVRGLEQDLASYLGVKHAITLNSGTDALVIALRALNIGLGDEVITSPFSFFATAEAIALVGASPVFVDIGNDFNIDADLIEVAITKKTRAIMPVHLFGQPAQMTKIMTIAQKYSLKVIEDCAQSIGAAYFGKCEGCNSRCDSQIRNEITGKMTGNIGDIGCYSFYPTKNLGAYGDGGMLTTNDDKIAKLAKMLRNHGSEKRYHNEMLGYNSRLDDIQAAILRVKLPHLNRYNEARRNIAKYYNELFAGLDITTPNISDGHIFHQYTLRVATEKREALQETLKQNDIGSMLYYPIPQNRLTPFKHLQSHTPVSDQVATEIISLPIWPQMDRAKQERVAEVVRKVLG